MLFSSNGNLIILFSNKSYTFLYRLDETVLSIYMRSLFTWLLVLSGAKYSRMDQMKFVEETL